MKRYLQLRERFTNRILQEYPLMWAGVNGKFIMKRSLIRIQERIEWPTYICEEIIYD